MSGIVIIGQIIGQSHYFDMAHQTEYLQRQLREKSGGLWRYMRQVVLWAYIICTFKTPYKVTKILLFRSKKIHYKFFSKIDIKYKIFDYFIDWKKHGEWVFFALYSISQKQIKTSIVIYYICMLYMCIKEIRFCLI